MIYIKFKKTHPDAVLPQANNKETGTGDSGYDLTSIEQITIESKRSAVVNVGLTLADLTPGYWLRIEPRSGLGFKHGIQPHLGVIDNGYRGDLGVKLYNFSDHDHLINKGDRIAQLVMYPLLQPQVSFTDEVTETSRGDKGFGSSDEKPHVVSQYHDDWFYKNTYQVDEGSIEHPWFDNVDEFNAYAAKTNMPSDIHDALLKNKSWIKPTQ